jgi:hypothetical protein
MTLTSDITDFPHIILESNLEVWLSWVNRSKRQWVNIANIDRRVNVYVERLISNAIIIKVQFSNDDWFNESRDSSFKLRDLHENQFQWSISQVTKTVPMKFIWEIRLPRTSKSKEKIKKTFSYPPRMMYSPPFMKWNCISPMGEMWRSWYFKFCWIPYSLSTFMIISANALSALQI